MKTLSTVMDSKCLSFVPYIDGKVDFDSIVSIPSGTHLYADILNQIHSGKLSIDEISREYIKKELLLPNLQSKSVCLDNLISALGLTKDDLLNYFMVSYVKVLQDKELPTQPLESLISKLLETNLSNVQKIEILAAVETSQIPITWDGDLVFYSRASFTKKVGSTTSTGVFNNAPFENGKSYFFDQSNPAIAGNLNWVYNVCSDTGVIQELVVGVNNILDFSLSGTVFNCRLKEFQYLTVLDEKFRLEQDSITPVVIINNRTDSLGNEFRIRQPYSPSTLVNYLYGSRGTKNLKEAPAVVLNSVTTSC